jgi:hypothetical protein
LPSSHIVILSINSDDQSRCVDIFTRPDGNHGFEEFRRDAEDARGWFPIGGFSGLVVPTKEDALAMARLRIAWFAEKGV